VEAAAQRLEMGVLQAPVPTPRRSGGCVLADGSGTGSDAPPPTSTRSSRGE